MTGAQFGLIHAWVYGCSVLGCSSSGLSGTTIDLGYVSLLYFCKLQNLFSHRQPL